MGEVAKALRRAWRHVQARIQNRKLGFFLILKRGTDLCDQFIRKAKVLDVDPFGFICEIGVRKQKNGK
jgi:hypothetical protein